MRIGLIRRSHDLNQRRRASSAVNADCPTARPRLGSGPGARRASSTVTDGPGAGVDEGYHPKSRSMTLGGYRARQDSEFGTSRSNSQDSTGGDMSSSWSDSTETMQKQSSGEGDEELCNGKVLSVLGVIVIVLLLTLGFAAVIKYLYR